MKYILEFWIPAFAGMTEKNAGMTEKNAGMTKKKNFVKIVER